MIGYNWKGETMKDTLIFAKIYLLPESTVYPNWLNSMRLQFKNVIIPENKTSIDIDRSPQFPFKLTQSQQQLNIQFSIHFLGGGWNKNLSVEPGNQ